MQQLWREERVQRPTPRRLKRARTAYRSVRRHRAEHPHQVWAMNVQCDANEGEIGNIWNRLFS